MRNTFLFLISPPVCGILLEQPRWTKTLRGLVRMASQDTLQRDSPQRPSSFPETNTRDWREIMPCPHSQPAATHPEVTLSDPGIGSYWLQSSSRTLMSSQLSSSEPSRQSLSPLHTRWRFRQRPEERPWMLLECPGLLPLPHDLHP